MILAGCLSRCRRQLGPFFGAWKGLFPFQVKLFKRSLEADAFLPAPISPQ